MRRLRAVDDQEGGVEKVSKGVQTVHVVERGDGNGEQTKGVEEDVEERLCILADTSYGACCVDEVAAVDCFFALQDKQLLPKDVQ